MAEITHKLAANISRPFFAAVIFNLVAVRNEQMLLGDTSAVEVQVSEIAK